MKHIASSISELSIVSDSTLCQQEVSHSFSYFPVAILSKEDIAQRGKVLEKNITRQFDRVKKHEVYKPTMLHCVAHMAQHNYKEFLVLEHMIDQFVMFPLTNKGFFKSRERIARDVGVSVITVRRALDKLYKAKVIAKVHRYTKIDEATNRQTSNYYMLNTGMYDHEIMQLLEPLLPGLKACQLANEPVIYERATLYLRDNKSTPSDKIPTYREYQTNKILQMAHAFREMIGVEAGEVSQRQPNQRQRPKKFENKRRTNPLNGIVYVANNLEERPVFDVKDRPRTFQKKQEKAKESKPIYHMPYQPAERKPLDTGGRKIELNPQARIFYDILFPNGDGPC